MAKAKQIRAVVVDQITGEVVFDETWMGKKYESELRKEAFRAAKEHGASAFIGSQEVGASGWALWEYEPGSKFAEGIWLSMIGKYATKWEQIQASV